jgi:hypothetical protein
VNLYSLFVYIEHNRDESPKDDRTIPNNKPDIKICDNKQGTCVSIDDAIPGDRNVIKKEAEGILKYKSLIMEIQRMWNVAASDTGSNRGDWNHFRITQTILEQHKEQSHLALHIYCGKC